MQEATIGQALLAAGVVALLYSAGGLPRVFAGALVLTALIVPGPSGTSLAEGVLGFLRDRLTGD